MKLLYVHSHGGLIQSNQLHFDESVESTNAKIIIATEMIVIESRKKIATKIFQFRANKRNGINWLDEVQWAQFIKMESQINSSIFMLAYLEEFD